ncbi:hypothetical protein COY33_01435 [candidate division WWE3 bacterium CG_4_10_14_0_2_um_filter_42_7]|uniref:Uncharacterized protein n=1 Tax=candidate division WWE3 bacterium CG_4_10_14_0_2_um_filter_42_7 TaxID=1975073 RepID=A0A2M7TDH3_UNCKA|nr:MAG: hypothetical protein COY33_01435 [candidate division WWE3 bacterium CG_4_10_14_0_2_um_filter_42_7]
MLSKNELFEINSKHEIRISKSETNSKFEFDAGNTLLPIWITKLSNVSNIRIFVIEICFEFRISCLLGYLCIERSVN